MLRSNREDLKNEQRTVLAKVKRTFVILMISYLSVSGIVLADDGSGVGYFTRESAKIIANIVLFPFRLIRDIFDPQPQPVLMPYYAPAPTVVAPAAAVPVAAPTPMVPAASEGPVEIDIPNGNGSYTTVALTRTAQGYLGPQGEFYPERPTAEQLRERYLKK